MIENVSRESPQSGSDWVRIDDMTDDEIDYSDIPALDDAFFEAAELRMPQPKGEIRVQSENRPGLKPLGYQNDAS